MRPGVFVIDPSTLWWREIEKRLTFAAMQKITGTLLILAVLLSSCSNDFDLTADWQDIPIVYGILSPVDTAHYIRVEKAFLDPKTSALALAREPDSLYYDDVEVTLVHVNSGDSYILQEVDGTLEGYPREPGIFAEMPNILFKVKAETINLAAGDTYRIIVNRGENLPEVTAQTEIVRRPSIRRPLQGQNLTIDYQNFLVARWDEADAGFYDVSLILNYREYPTGDPSMSVSKSLKWKFGKRVTGDEHQVQGINFYQFVGAMLEADPGIQRIFVDLNFIVQAAGEELEEFLTISQANTGITSVGEIPQYSNIEGGRGIFSSINQSTVTEVNLQPVSLDSLRNGIYTEDLNF